MKELDRISDYITQLENERAELNKQVDNLKSDIEILKYLIKNNDIQVIPDANYQTEPVKTLATIVKDRVNDALTESKGANVDPVNPNDTVTNLSTYIKRLGDAVDWEYTDDSRQWTYVKLNELVAIVEGNHIARKNLDVMSSEIDLITREIQNDNFGLYRTFTSTHMSLDTYKFESTRELAETIQKLSDSFIRSCEHLEVAIGNLKVAQLCRLNKEIDSCVECAHNWRKKSGVLRCVENRPKGPTM